MMALRLTMLASNTARNFRRIRQPRTGVASPSRFWRFALLAALTTCIGCSGDKTPSGKQQQTNAATSGADNDSAKVNETEKTVVADVVFRGGKVFTVDENQPWAEAVAVKGNKIVYVGDSAGAADFIGEETRLIDTTDKTVMPGFISTHDHLIASYWTNAGVQLFDADNMDEYVERIKRYAEANPDHKVIKGIGWSAGKLGRRPTAEELDRAVPDRPAIILDFTVHDAWLNTKAMEAAKINKDTPDSVPGVTFWVRDDDGVPTGCAIEGQWFGAYIASGAWEPETMIRDSIDTLFGIAAKNGTTTFLNPGIVTPNMTDVHGGMESDFKAAMSVLQEMDEAGKLKLRTFAQPFFKNPDGDPDRFIAFASDMRKIYSSDRLGVISVKIHPEGNWIAEVAPFLEPYESGKTGTFNIAPEKIKAIMVAVVVLPAPQWKVSWLRGKPTPASAMQSIMPPGSIPTINSASSKTRSRSTPLPTLRTTSPALTKTLCDCWARSVWRRCSAAIHTSLAPVSRSACRPTFPAHRRVCNRRCFALLEQSP